MSVSNTAKCEIVKKNNFADNNRYLLEGFFMTAGSLVITSNGMSFSLSTECVEAMDFIEKTLLENYSNLELEKMSVVGSLRGKERITLTAKNGGLAVLEDLGFIVHGTNGELAAKQIPESDFLKDASSMKAFLSGAFLGSGVVSVPSEGNKKSYGYHFEIDVNSKDQADVIAEIMTNFDIFPKVIERGEEYIVYLKNSDAICDALALFGSSKFVLETMNQKVSREQNSQINRQINCISANIDKTISAALRQLASIEVIRSTIGLENLPEPLLEVALSRLANPEGSLSDLLKTLGSKITKGALAQRFDKINKIAEELGEHDEK